MYKQDLSWLVISKLKSCIHLFISYLAIDHGLFCSLQSSLNYEIWDVNILMQYGINNNTRCTDNNYIEIQKNSAYKIQSLLDYSKWYTIWSAKYTKKSDFRSCDNSSIHIYCYFTVKTFILNNCILQSNLFYCQLFYLQSYKKNLNMASNELQSTSFVQNQ